MIAAVPARPTADAEAGAALLDVQGLCVEFPTRGGALRAVNGVSFMLGHGQILAVLGESGSGKSMLLKTIMGLQPAAARVSGRALLRGADLLRMSERRNVRGAQISMVFQNPMTALDPVFTVEQQIVETLRRHTSLSRQEARRRTVELLGLVQIPSPETRLGAYPWELSVGLRQRVVIAMALACDPSLLLADEPTTALDVTVQARVLALLRHVQRQRGMSVVLVTHDVAVAAEIADQVVVMYAGRVVESGPIRAVLDAPRHPYTRGLLQANVRPGQKERPVAIPGAPPHLARLPAGCAFAPRCAVAVGRCWERVPALQQVGRDHSARCLLLASA